MEVHYGITTRKGSIQYCCTKVKIRMTIRHTISFYGNNMYHTMTKKKRTRKLISYSVTVKLRAGR